MMSKKSLTLAGALALAVAGTAWRAAVFTPAEAAAAPAQAQAGAKPTIVVYKSPTCGCCAKWVDHVKAAGYKVETHDISVAAELTKMKVARGITPKLMSCHLALVGGYALEGHVPAADIARLLRDKPKIAGLAVPGMPMGSPGMEVPGYEADKYDVVAFTKDGKTSVYATH